MSNLKLSDYIKSGNEIFVGMVIRNSVGDAHIIREDLKSVMCRTSGRIIYDVNFKLKGSVWTTEGIMHVTTKRESSAIRTLENLEYIFGGNLWKPPVGLMYSGNKKDSALNIIEESGMWVFCTALLEFVPSEAAKVSKIGRESWDGKGVPPEGEVCWIKYKHNSFNRIVMGPRMEGKFLYTLQGVVYAGDLEYVDFSLKGEPTKRELDTLKVEEYLANIADNSMCFLSEGVAEGIIDILDPKQE
jgi:hypothetical protein